MATSDTISARRARRARGLAVALRPDSCSEPATGVCNASRAGTSPNRTLASRERSALKAKTRTLRATSASRGRPWGCAARIGGKAGVGDQQPDQAAEHALERALGEELSQQAEAARAQGQAHGHLPAAGEGTGQLEARHVRAGEEEDESNGPEEEEDDRPRAPHDLFLQGDDADAPAGVFLWMLLGEGGRQRLEILFASFDVHIGPHPRQHVQEPVVARRARRERGVRGHDVPGNPQLGRRPWQVEARGHDPDHAPGHAVHVEDAAHHGGVAAEAACPEAVAHHHHAIPAGMAIGHVEDGAPLPFGCEGPAKRRRDGHHPEEIGGDLDGFDHRRLAIAAKRRGARAVLPGGHGLEGAILRVPVQEVSRRGVLAITALRSVGVEDRHQSLRLAVGQWPEQHRVENAEERGVGPDAQGQRGRGGQGEARLAAQAAQRVAQILPEAAEARARGSEHRSRGIGASADRLEPQQGSGLKHVDGGAEKRAPGPAGAVLLGLGAQQVAEGPRHLPAVAAAEGRRVEVDQRAVCPLGGGDRPGGGHAESALRRTFRARAERTRLAKRRASAAVTRCPRGVSL